MGFGAVVFQALMSFNRFLYRWASHSGLVDTRSFNHAKSYDSVLQEFILIKTQYKVLTSVLKKKKDLNIYLSEDRGSSTRSKASEDTEFIVINE